MAAMKTMLEYVIDSGSTMTDFIDVEIPTTTKLQLGIAIVASHISQRIMASKTFESGVCAYGTGITKNYLATGTDYQDVSNFFNKILGIPETFILHAM